MATNDSVTTRNSGIVPIPKLWPPRMDNLILVLGMMAGLAGAIWQGGRVEATLEGGLRAEAEARARDIEGLRSLVAGQSQDIRDVRAWIIGKQQHVHE